MGAVGVVSDPGAAALGEAVVGVTPPAVAAATKGAPRTTSSSDSSPTSGMFSKKAAPPAPAAVLSIIMLAAWEASWRSAMASADISPRTGIHPMRRAALSTAAKSAAMETGVEAMIAEGTVGAN